MSNRKIELRVLKITSGRMHNNAYNVMLQEMEHQHKFEIIIGHFEANAIGVAIENQSSTRPMTHDLILSILEELKAEVNEVIIKRLHEGVFYSVIMMEHNGYIHEIDSRTSDALAIALRVGCPIYTYPKIISQVLNPQAFIEELKINISIIHGATDDENKKDDLQQLSKEQLTEQLNELLANEEYEKAAAIRDELSKR